MGALPLLASTSLLAQTPPAPADAAPEEEDLEDDLDDDDLESLEEIDALSEELEADEEVEEGDDLGAIAPVTVQYAPPTIARETGSVDTLDEQDMEALEYDDVHSVVRQLPGVYTRTEDGFGLRPNIGIRGVSSDRSKKITLMEDGVLFAPAPYAAPAAYYFPVSARMVGVEVFKGPGTIAYGPYTVGGALNLITREVPHGVSAGADVALGAYATGKAHGWAGSGGDQWGLMLEGIHLQSDGFKELDGGGDTGFTRSEFMLKGRVSSDPTSAVYQSVQLKATYSREHSDETYLGLTDEDFEQNPYRRYRASQLDRMDWDRYAAQLAWRVEFGGDVDVTTTAYHQMFSRTWAKFNDVEVDGQRPASLPNVLDAPSAGVNRIFYDTLRGEGDTVDTNGRVVYGTNARDFVSQGVQSVLRWRHEDTMWSNRFEGGLRLHHDWVERDQTEALYDFRGGDLVFSSSLPEPVTLNRDEATALSAHLLDQFSFWRMTITPGVRAEAIRTSHDDRTGDGDSENTQLVALPALGAQITMLDHLDVLAGVHRGFSPLAPGQDEGTRAETSVNYEAGLRWSDAPNRLLIEAVGFLNDYSNLSESCTAASGCVGGETDEQTDLNGAYVWGGEFLADYLFALAAGHGLSLRASYTLTQSYLQQSGSTQLAQFGSIEEGDELPYLPTHQATARVGYLSDRINVNVGGSYTSPMREVASQGDEGRRTDAIVLVDALASYRVWRELRAYVKGENLLDRAPISARRPFGTRPIRPLFWQVGAKFEW